MKKFKKAILYLLTYVLVTFSTAFGVVLISNPTGANSVKIEENTDTVAIAPQLNYIMNKLGTVDALSANINANIKTQSDSYKVGLCVDADLSAGFEKAELSGEVNVEINNAEPINVDLVYKQENIYISVLNGNYQVATNNIVSSVTQILTLLNVELPELNLGIDLETLSLTTVLEMLSNLTEQKTATETILTISLPMVGNMVVVCDLNYSIKSISLPETTLDGITFSVEMGLDYPNEISVETPTFNFIDVTHLFKIAESAINTLKQDVIAIDATVNYNNVEFNGKLTANLKNYNAMFESVIANNNLTVSIIDNIIYIDYANIALKFALTDIQKVSTLLNNQFNLDIPLTEIVGMLLKVKDGELSNTINSINLSSMDLSAIDLGIINHFAVTSGGYIISLENIGNVELTINNAKINNIKFKNSDLSVDASFVKPSTIQLSHNNYANISTLIPAVDAIFNTFKHNNFNGVVTIGNNNIDLNINYELKLDNNLYLKLWLTVLNKPLTLQIYNNYYYITYSNTQLYGDIAQLPTIINDILNKLNIEISKPDSNEIIDTINDLINTNINPQLITNLAEIKDGVNIEFLNNLSITLNYLKTLTNINVKVNDINVNATINTTSNITIPNLNNNEFTNVKDLSTTTLNIIDYVFNNKYYFNINFAYDNYLVTGFVNIDNQISAELTTNILNKDITAKLLNNVVYLTIDGFNIKFNLSDIPTVIDFVNDNFGFNLNAEIQNITSSLDIEQTINTILTELEKLDLTINNNFVMINYEDINATVNFAENKLNSLNISANNINASICVLDQKQPIVLDDYYFDLINALPLIKSIINTVNANAISGNLSVRIDDINLNINLKIQTKPTLQVWAQTTIMGCDVRFNLLNETIYLSIDALNIKVGFNEFDKLINFVNNNLNLNINTTDMLSSVNNISLSDIYLGNILITHASENSFAIDAFNANVALNFNSYLQKLTLIYNNITIKLDFNAYNSNVKMPTIKTQAYENVDYIIDFATDLIQTIKTQNLQLAGTFNYDELSIDYLAQVKFDNGLQAKLNLNILNKQVEIIYHNNTAYINVDGFMLKLNTSNLDELLNQLKTNFNIDLAEMLNSTLNSNQSLVDSIYINKIAKQNNNLLIRVYYGSNPINLTLNLTEQNTLNKICVNAFGLNIDTTINTTSNQIDYNPQNYTTDINSLFDIITPVKNIIDSQHIQAQGTISFNLFNSNQVVNIKNLKVAFQNSLFVEALVEFNGITASITIQNQTIYIDGHGLQTKIALSDIPLFIDWINETFNTNIVLPDAEIKITDIENMLKDINLSMINKIEKTPNGILLTINNNEIYIDYNSMLSKVLGSYAGVNFDLTLDTHIFEVVDINSNNFVNYSEITNFITSIINYINTKQFNLVANAKVFNGESLRFNADVNLLLDITTGLLLNGSANLTGEQNIKFDLDYYNKYMFVNYNNLKLKMSEADLKEIMVVGLELLGIDPNLIPFLQDAANGLDININNISSILPSLDFGNPLSMLSLLKQISYYDNKLILTIDGTQVTTNPNATTMEVVVETNGTRPTHIYINNMYTGVTKNEYFNLDVQFSDFKQVVSPDQNSYIDLSGSNELIKALVNTAELNYYEVTANVDVDGTLLGFINIDWTIPLNIKIKLDENRMPQIMMTLGEIPTIGLVNKGTLESVKNRMFYLYYADGFAYLHRNETNSNKPYDLKLKLALSDVLADPLYVLQFATGFSDDIMGAIYDSIEKSKGHVPNLGNVINYFTVKDKTNFELQLNMHEITNDNMLGDMTIGLGVINNDQTNNKNYLGKASFKMEMPIAKGVFDIKLESNDLTLINIGKTLDFTALNNYINSYPYKEGEEYEIVNGKATLASQKQYTITFEENGGNDVSDITAVKDTPITLPTFENRSVVDTANGTRTIYRFAGWYQSSEFEEHTKFTETHMSRGNKVLYAKWEVVAVDYVRTISFNSNGGSSIDSISEVAGVWIDVSNKVPTKANTYVDKGYNWFNEHAGKWTYEVTRYTFAGWYTDSSLTTKFNGYVPNYNTTLYAKWNASTTTEYYYNWERP